MNKTELQEILEKHAAWLRKDPKGKLADLSGANLRWADLSGADLRFAYLSGADLRGAYLSGASGTFSSYGGRHNGIAVGGYISIGCERHTYQEWLDHGVEIVKQNEYTDAEIKHYMDWIVSAIECWKAEEKPGV